MLKRDLIYYQKSNGEIPVKVFINSLEKKNSKLLAKIFYKLDLLSLGLLGENDVKFLKDKIFELRIKESSNIARVFYFIFDGESIVLLDGIIKKTQKLPPPILEKVIQYKEDHLKHSF